MDAFAVENQLYSYLFSHVQEIIDHRVRGKTKKEVRELFQGYIDLENYARIIRMKKGFGPIRSSLRKIFSLSVL